jgi:hypothetical protein
MQQTDRWKETIGPTHERRPAQVGFLTPALERAQPVLANLSKEHVQSTQIARDRKVIQIALQHPA